MADEASGGGPIEVTVAVDDENAADLGSVADRLATAGLREAEPQPAIGVITGVVDHPDALRALEGVEGVAAVEVSRRFQLPPPDSPIQ